MRAKALGVVLFTSLLLASCRAAAWRDYLRTEPVEHYFYYPPARGVAGPPPLFVALLGDRLGPLDCIELFYQFAEDRQFALVCPRLGGREGLADVVQAERDLAGVLGNLYAEYTFQEQFYLTGFAEGADFALAYALRYPGAVSGVSAMSIGTYPESFVPPGPLPVQLIVGEEDEEGLAAARDVEQVWNAQGILVRVVEIEGDGRSPSQAFARFASGLIDQIELR